MMRNHWASCRAHAPPRGSPRRGLTLIELMLALSISVMVAGAMSGMLTAVSTGVASRQDTRSVMVRSTAAHAKLAAYINPARAIWAVDDHSIAIWFNDYRQGGGIHSTEVRWIVYDPDNDVVEVRFIKFPDDWSQTSKDLADVEYLKTQSDQLMYEKYLSQGYMATLRLLDGVEDFSIALDNPTPLEARRVTFTISFTTQEAPLVVTVPCTIAHHQPPVR